MSHGAGYPFTKSLPIPRSWHVLLSFLLKAFIFLPFTSRSAIRLELNFVDGMRQKVHHLFVSKWISNWPCTIYWKKNNCYPFPLHCSVSSDRHQVSLCSDLLLNSDLSHWFSLPLSNTNPLSIIKSGSLYPQVMGVFKIALNVFNHLYFVCIWGSDFSDDRHTDTHTCQDSGQRGVN